MVLIEINAKKRFVFMCVCEFFFLFFFFCKCVRAYVRTLGVRTCMYVSAHRRVCACVRECECMRNGVRDVFTAVLMYSL